METRSAKKKKAWFRPEEHDDDDTKGEDGADRLSDLPDVVLHNILLLLPIKTIAQTSVLSKRWRSLWSTFPDLDFTTVTATTALMSTEETKCKKSTTKTPHRRLTAAKGIDFIGQVLSLRDKRSDIRILRIRAPLSFSSLNALIRSAVRHNVQELDVEVATEDYFNFPRSAITSDSLRVFRLKSRYPGFRLAPSSIMRNGFRSLHSLSLSVVVLYNQPSLTDLFTDSSFPRLKKLSLDALFGLKNLKISCRGLEDLTLENCFQLQGLEIWGERLERLRVASCFDVYYEKSWVRVIASRLHSFVWEYNAVTGTCFLENLSSLQSATVGFFMLHEHVNVRSVAQLKSVSSLLSGLTCATCLTLQSQCVEILSEASYSANVTHPFTNLKLLELHTGFNQHNVLGLACIFKSSPMLQTLVLKIINDYKIERRKWKKEMWEMAAMEEQFWEAEARSLKSFLSHLNVVKIDGFLECENEVILAKFLLKHGKALQEMTITTGHCNHRDSMRRQMIRSQMMGFSRASSKANISFL